MFYASCVSLQFLSVHVLCPCGSSGPLALYPADVLPPVVRPDNYHRENHFTGWNSHSSLLPLCVILHYETLYRVFHLIAAIITGSTWKGLYGAHALYWSLTSLNAVRNLGKAPYNAAEMYMLQMMLVWGQWQVSLAVGVWVLYNGSFGQIHCVLTEITYLNVFVTQWVISFQLLSYVCP